MANYIIEVTYLGGLVMSRTTRFLKLFLPSDNDYYRVEQDQNENFEKIDKKLEEWDTGKEPTIKYKRTGFNLDKTDSYEEDNTNKLATAKALYLLWVKLKNMISGIRLTWDAIEEKPSTFPPSTHNHDDRYYTQTKSDNRLNGLAGKKDGTFPLSSARKGEVYALDQNHKFYVCTQDYLGETLSVPNSNFIEMSVYENLNRLNNLHKFFKKNIENDFIKITFFHDKDDQICYGFVTVKRQFRIESDRVVCENTLHKAFGGIVTTKFKGNYEGYFFRGFFLTIEENYVYADEGNFTVHLK